MRDRLDFCSHPPTQFSTYLDGLLHQKRLVGPAQSDMRITHTELSGTRTYNAGGVTTIIQSVHIH
jgi:hypothetical protein